jgi:hypothetical protein
MAFIFYGGIESSFSTLYAHYAPQPEEKPAHGPWDRYKSLVPVPTGALRSDDPSIVLARDGFAFMELTIVR